MRLVEQPPEPWRSFFAEVDAILTEETQLYCCGGFVVTQRYGVARTTSDVDFMGAVPNVQSHLIEIAGKGTALHRKHKLYLDAVTVATPPEDYELRLVPMFPGTWNHLWLHALALTISRCRSWNGTTSEIAMTSSNSPAPATCQRRF